MIDTLIWVVTVLLIIVSLFQFILGTVAPKRFWRRLDDYNVSVAMFLWGFSHPFGPRCHNGQPPAWERLKD